MTLVQSYQPLANSAFGRASHIDLLLGIGEVYRAYRESKDVSADGSIRMDNTLFGWTVSGQIQDFSSRATILTVSATPMDALLEKLWEMKQHPEELVTQHYFDHYQRDDSGIYSVSLPRHNPPPELGESLPQALK